MSAKTKIMIYLIVFCLVDTVIPFPILGVILIYVALRKPPWFVETVRDVYT